MTRREINLIGGFYKDSSLPWSAQDTVNWLPVPAQEGGTRSPMKLRGAPGLRQLQPPVTAPVLVLLGDAPDASTSQSYSYAYGASGGIPPYSFGIDSGALPAGLSLSPSGVVSGTTAATTSTNAFVVRVQDSASNVATKPDSISVFESSSSVALSIWNKLIDWYSNETNGSTILGRKAGITQAFRSVGTGPHSVTNPASPVGNAIQFSGGTSATNSSGYTSGYGVTPSLSYNSSVSVWNVMRLTAAPDYQSYFSMIRLASSAAFFPQASVVLGGVALVDGTVGIVWGVASGGNNSLISSVQPSLNSWFSYYFGQAFDGTNRTSKTAINGESLVIGPTRGASSVSGDVQLCLAGGTSGTDTSNFQSGPPPQVQLSEQAFFSDELTQAEINYLQNGGTYRTFDQLKTDAGIP